MTRKLNILSVGSYLENLARWRDKSQKVHKWTFADKLSAKGRECTIMLLQKGGEKTPKTLQANRLAQG